MKVMRDFGTIAFIGAGRMSTAMATGLLNRGFPPAHLRAVEIQPQAAAQFMAATGVAPANQAAEAIAAAAIVIVAVKPQQAQAALAPLRSLLADKLLLSIAAGLRLADLATWTGCSRIVRAMPNTPALIGEGAAAYALSEQATDADALAAEAILGAVGFACRVEEKLLDAVTGLSGSGPAYVFDFIQALADGGVAAGLPRDLARQLAIRTVLGAARLLLESDRHPAELRDQVTSPGGTTARGLAVLEEHAFRGTVAAAVVAAAERSRELGGNS
jgi:pyrroline-5-carboxylate reductase